MTLAQRTPAGSPFAILYAPRAEIATATAPKKRGPKSKAKPAKEVAKRAATRVNKYLPTAASWAGVNGTETSLKKPANGPRC